MERGVAAPETMGLVLNHSELLAQPLEQHSCLDSSDVRHKPLPKVAMESPLLLNKNVIKLSPPYIHMSSAFYSSSQEI